MAEITELNARLIGKGLLTEEQILQAEDYALTRGIVLDEALVFLNLIEYADLGQELAEVFGISYHPLLENPPPHQAKLKVPLKLSEKYKIFPVSYDPDQNSLTIAVDDPENEERNGQLESIFPTPTKLSFKVASSVEIDKAIDVYYRGKTYAPAREVNIPEDFLIVDPDDTSRAEIKLDETALTRKKILLLEPDLDRAGALKTLLKGEGYSKVKWVLSPKETIKELKDRSCDVLLFNSRIFQPEDPWFRDISKVVRMPHISYDYLAPLLLGQEYPYQQMSSALINLVAHLVRKSLKNDNEKQQEIRMRVRYCKLLALRMGLSPRQVDASEISAWLYANGLGKELTENIATPYGLEEIILTESDTKTPKRVEAAVLNLVVTYQTIRRRNPEMAKDINKARQILSQHISLAENEAMLEAFLQLLRDEEFLRKVDQPSRRIIIVDPNQTQESSVALRLGNDGFEVLAVSDAQKAAEIIMKSDVDLIISELKLPGTDGMRFCQALKGNSDTAHLPFFFLTQEEGERIHAECLNAGADEFLKKPVDLEVLSLKIERTLISRSSPSTKGVRGSLNEMNFTDIIQSLTSGDKDVEIALEYGGEKGMVYVQNGEIIHASAEKLDGEEAFYKLMTWEDGDFQIVSCKEFPDRNIHAPAMSLLMEGARLADEGSEEMDDEE